MAAGSGERLSIPTKLFYGSGAVAFGVKDNGFSSLLLLFYNQVVGLNAQMVGLAIMIALILDSIIDPIVGQASDNLRSRWGRRHPFMYAAAIPVAISYGLLWSPPDWSPEALFVYLIVVAVIIRTFVTLYEIPSSALAAELTRDYDERTSVMSYRYFFGWWGGLGMTLLAFMVFLKPTAEHPIGQLNPDGYVNYGLAASGLMLAAILISALGTHRHIPKLVVPPQRKLDLATLAREMVGTLAHRSFLMLMVAGLFNAVATGLVLSLNLYFNTFFWELGPRQIALFAIINFAAAAAAFVLAAPLSRRIGKKSAAQLCKGLAFVFAIAGISLRLLGVLPANGDPLLLPLLLFFSCTSTAFSIASAILISSMIIDVVEDSEVRTGRRSEGLFFSASAFVSKAVSGVGIFAASVVLLLVGFPNGAKPGSVPPDVIERLGLAYIPILAALYGGAMMAVAFYRINRESHGQALAQLRAAPASEAAE